MLLQSLQLYESPISLLTVLSIILAVVSILTTLVLGTIAVFQAYHYYKLSNISNKNIEDLTKNINNAVIELKAVNKQLSDEIIKLFGKTIGKIGKGVDTDIKRDILKGVTDSSDELKGILDKQGKESQVSIDDLKAQVMIINEGMQRLFKIVMKQFEPEISEEELRSHLLEKISHLTDTLTFCSFKDLIQIISHQQISYDKIIAEIKKMKEEGLITYDGDELFDDTKITIVKKD